MPSQFIMEPFQDSFLLDAGYVAVNAVLPWSKGNSAVAM